MKYFREDVSAEIKQIIINFFESEEVSQMHPGRKDCISEIFQKVCETLAS